MLDGEIAAACGRQVQLQRLPVIAAVEGNEDAGLEGGEYELVVLWIFADGVGGAIGQPCVDYLPALAVIIGAIDARGICAAAAAATSASAAEAASRDDSEGARGIAR